jgi:hypothetical protein
MEPVVEDNSKLSIDNIDDYDGSHMEKLLKCMMGVTSGKEGLRRFLSTKGWDYINKILKQEADKTDYTQMDDNSVILVGIIGQTCLQHSSPKLLKQFLGEFINWFISISQICRKSHSKLKFQLMDILAYVLDIDLPLSFQHELEISEKWKENIRCAIYDILRSKVTQEQTLPSISLAARMMSLYGEGWIFSRNGTEDDVKDAMLLLQCCCIEIRMILGLDWAEIQKLQSNSSQEQQQQQQKESKVSKQMRMATACFTIIEQCIDSLASNDTEEVHIPPDYVQSYAQLSPNQLLDLQKWLMELVNDLCAYLEDLQAEMKLWSEDQVKTQVFCHPLALASVRLLALWLSVDMESLHTSLDAIMPILIEFCDQCVDGLYPIEFFFPFFFQLADSYEEEITKGKEKLIDEKQKEACHLFKSFIDSHGLRVLHRYLTKRYMLNSPHPINDDSCYPIYSSSNILMVASKYFPLALLPSEWDDLSPLFETKPLLQSDHNKAA